jgi:hypothetical protein
MKNLILWTEDRKIKGQGIKNKEKSKIKLNSQRSTRERRKRRQ